MAAHAVGWLVAASAARAHGHDQGPLRRLHDDHAQPLGAADARRSRTWSRARCGCSTRPTPAGGPCACSASACIISRQRDSVERRRSPPFWRINRSRRCVATREPRDGHLEPGAVREVPKRARAALRGSAGARSTHAGDAHRRSGMRHRQAHTQAARRSSTREKPSASTGRRACSRCRGATAGCADCDSKWATSASSQPPAPSTWCSRTRRCTGSRITPR